MTALDDRIAVDHREEAASWESREGPAQNAQIGEIEDWEEVAPCVGGRDVGDGGQVEKSCCGDGAGEGHEGEREDGKGV